MRLFDLHKSFALRVLAAPMAEGEGGAGGGGNPPPGGGAPPPAFAETLPADLRNDPVFKDIKDLAGLAKTYRDTAKMVGVDKARLLALPKDDTDAEGYTKLYTALGRPEKADAYEIPKPANNGAYSDADVALQKTILPILHEAGISQRQLNAIVPKWNEAMAGVAKAQEAAATTAREDAAKALKTELGAAYDGKLADAQAALRHLSTELKLGDSLLKELDNSKLGNSPAMFKLLSHLGAQLKEDGLLGKAVGGHEGGLSPAEAKQQIAAMERDKDKFAILRDKTHPKHADMQAERMRLYEMAYPAAEVA